MQHVAAPLSLRGLILRNRLAKSALTERLAAPSGAPDQRLFTLYERWSKSGAALLITGNVMIDRTQIAEPGNVIVEDERDLGALRRWADIAQAQGAHAFVQINHPGRQAVRTVNKARVVAPSAVGLKGMAGSFATPRVLADREIEALIARFGNTASIVKSAGFRGVQIHAAHGYLIGQFLSPNTNLRSDRWGGNPDARARFLREVVRAVRAAVGDAYPVAVKLNSADFQRGGFDQEESMRVVDMLDAEGVDLLEVSGGTYESAAMMQELSGSASSRAREAFFMDYAERVRARTRMPIMLTGGFRSAHAMEQAVGAGTVDVVGLGRPLILEPDLCTRLLRDATAEALRVRLSTGQKRFDGFVQTSWYQAQINRMARGLNPDPKLARSWAAIRYFIPNNKTSAA